MKEKVNYKNKKTSVKSNELNSIKKEDLFSNLSKYIKYNMYIKVQYIMFVHCCIKWRLQSSFKTYS